MRHSTHKKGLRLPYIPICIIGAVILWDWTVQLYTWHGSIDVDIFMYAGLRLTEGMLMWTREFEENKLPVVQFLFYIPVLLDSVRAWQLFSMGVSLTGACAVYAVVRSVFSTARGFTGNLGHYTGLYGALFTLYLFSAISGKIHHIGPLAASLVMFSMLLLRHACRQGAGAAIRNFHIKPVLLLLLSCLCGSLAVGIRPYLLFAVGLIPLWATMSVQMENGKIDCAAAAKICILWNLCVALFVFGVNALPYIAAGELETFIDGLEMTAGYTLSESAWRILLEQIMAFGRMDVISVALFLSSLAFAVYYPMFFLGGDAKARCVLYGCGGGGG